jgi:hypothetical protein
MKKEAVRNHHERGVEQVNHDGETNVVKPGDIPVSQKERLEYYDNGAPKEEEAVVDKRKNIETSYDDGGNPMATNESHRTSKPRPHQYSIERRLQEDRDPGSTTDIVSDASLEQATARAFTMIAPLVMSGTMNDSAIVKISNTTGVPIQNVMSLEKIARRSPDLVEKYASIPGVVKDTDEPGLEKESEPQCKCPIGKCQCSDKCNCKKEQPLAEEELNQIGIDCGLC